MTRLKAAILVVLATILVPSVALVHIVHAFYYTPDHVNQLYDGSTQISSGFLASNIGTSTEYAYNSPGPAGADHPQFWSSVETHSKNYAQVGYFVKNLRITLTGTEPNGTPIGFNQFVVTDYQHSPETNGVVQTILTHVYNDLLNALPYGIGNDVKDALCCVTKLTHGTDATSYWVDWTDPALAPSYSLDGGLYMAYQLAVDPSVQGTYSIYVHYHLETDGLTTCCVYQAASIDLFDKISYCYVTCSADFSMSASPTSVSVNSPSAFSSATSTITLTSLNSFAGPVTLTASGSDPSLHWSFSPLVGVTVPAGGSASSTITISAPMGTCKTGTFTITVTSEGGIGHSVDIVVSEACPPPDFTFWANPTTAVFNSQQVAGSNIYAQSFNGFTGTISLSYAISPNSGLSCYLSSANISLPSFGSQDSVGMLCTESFIGTYVVTITGTSGNLSHSVAITFINNSGGGGTCANCPKHS